MSSRSFSSVLAATLNPPPLDVFGAPGCVPAPERQFLPSATGFPVPSPPAAARRRCG
jgi:hypothetical protein